MIWFAYQPLNHQSLTEQQARSQVATAALTNQNDCLTWLLAGAGLSLLWLLLLSFAIAVKACI